MTVTVGNGLILSLMFALAGSVGNTDWQTSQTNVAACFAAMDREPALAIVNAKFARQSPTPSQLTDKSVPSEDEAEALRLRVKKTRPCREMRLAAVQEIHPKLEPAYQTLYYQADQVFDYLQQRAIDYGTANRLSASALALFREREALYFKGAAAQRSALAEQWEDQLSRGHSNPPPPSPEFVCEWEELNILCSTAASGKSE